MLSFLSILLLVAAAQAQKCCIPRAWTGVVGSILGNSGPNTQASGPITASNSYKMVYDANNMRIAYRVEADVTKFHNTGNVILDHRAGIQYSFKDDGSCARTTISTNFQEACIPDNAVDVGSTYFGTNNALNITTYQINLGSFTVYLTVTTKGCVPVTETLYGSYDHSYIMQVLGYSDITPGISDPSVFNPPASCSQVPLIHANQAPDFTAHPLDSLHLR